MSITDPKVVRGPAQDRSQTRPQPNGPTTPGAKPAWRRQLGFGNIGIVYVLIVLIVIFSFWAPNTFPTCQTAKTILNQNAIAGRSA